MQEKTKKYLKIVGNIGYSVFLLLLFVVAAFTAASALNIPGNYKLFVVMSGSMEPSIKTGSVVIVKPQPEYLINDIVTFYDSTDNKSTVTHRIQNVEQVDEQIVYTTKGDANETADPTQTSNSRVLGKVNLSIPFIGYLVGFAKTLTGFIILIVIPAVIIIYNEILNIIKEIKKWWQKRQNKTTENDKNTEKELLVIKTKPVKDKKPKETIVKKVLKKKQGSKKKSKK